ncbi:MAG: hypothetical protein K6E42_10155 [Synergistes sp.]|nr:hypothetical protein [Synergistes sp.]
MAGLSAWLYRKAEALREPYEENKLYERQTGEKQMRKVINWIITVITVLIII